MCEPITEAKITTPIPIAIYSVPLLVDRTLKLATAGVAVNLSYGRDFSLCVASIATPLRSVNRCPVIAG
jgi:hypothetical protein